jgi:hypothetical protein
VIIHSADIGEQEQAQAQQYLDSENDPHVVTDDALASSDDRIFHQLCQYALHSARQQRISAGASQWLLEWEKKMGSRLNSCTTYRPGRPELRLRVIGHQALCGASLHLAG